MNREILFKGKRTDNGEWVEGSLITGVFLRGGQDIPYILNADMADYDCFEDFSEENGIFEVDPDTICQYTGLNDKSGNKIWENDLIKFDNCGIYPIWWDNDYKAFGSCWYSDFDHMSKYRNVEMEIVGNKFDNPELLEVDHE